MQREVASAGAPPTGRSPRPAAVLHQVPPLPIPSPRCRPASLPRSGHSPSNLGPSWEGALGPRHPPGVQAPSPLLPRTPESETALHPPSWGPGGLDPQVPSVERDPGVWATSPCPLNTRAPPSAPTPPAPTPSAPPLAHLSALCPASSPADRGPHTGRAGVGVGVGAGGGRRGSPRLPPWPRTTWCPWSRPDRPPGRPPYGRSPRLSGGGRRPLRPGPPGCPPLLRGSPGGWAGPPPVGGPRSWGRGGGPGGVRPRESAWPGGAAWPPLPSPSLAGPPFLRLPPPGGSEVRAGGCCRPRSPPPPHAPSLLRLLLLSASPRHLVLSLRQADITIRGLRALPQS